MPPAIRLSRTPANLTRWINICNANHLSNVELQHVDLNGIERPAALSFDFTDGEHRYRLHLLPNIAKELRDWLNEVMK